jgi:hypothetical protein
MAGGERENEDIGVEKFHKGRGCVMTGEEKWKQLNCEEGAINCTAGNRLECQEQHLPPL